MSGRTAILAVMAVALFSSQPFSAPFEPRFVDINPDDSGATPNCDAPCPSGGSGGRVHRLASSKGRANEVYAASELGGLFKTTNLFSGSVFRWHHLDGHIPTKAFDVAVDPAGDIVYATSLFDGRIQSLAGIEVSTDRGETWTRPAWKPTASCSAGRRQQPSAFGIAIRPGASNEVLVGTNCGIARSEDYGATWKFTDPYPATARVQTVFDVAVLPGGLTYACGQDGVLKSPNGKTGWQRLPSPSDSTGAYAGYCSLAVHPDFPNAVFVVFSRTVYFDPILDIRQTAFFGSLDGGQTWISIPHPDGADPRFHKRVPMVAVNRRTAALDVWLGAGNLFRMPCTDTPFGLKCPFNDMTEWTETFTDGGGDPQKAHGDTGDVLFDPRDAKDACLRLYSSDGGVYFNVLDEEPGCHDPAFLSANEGLHAQLPLGMAGAERSGSVATEDIYVALQDNGLFATTNAGADMPVWNHAGGADWFDVVADGNLALAIIPTNPGPVLLSADPGFFNAVSVPGTPFAAAAFFGTFTDTIAQFGPDSYVMAQNAGPDVIFTTNLSPTTVLNGTVAWSSLNYPAGLPYPCGVRASRGPLSSAFYVLAGPQFGGGCLWRSENQLFAILPGANPQWERIDTRACPGGGVGIFAADPVRPGRLYASCTSQDPPLMVHSEDGGFAWAPDQALTDLMTGPGVFIPRVTDPDNGVTFTGAGDTAQPLVAGVVQPAMVAFDPRNENILVAGGYESGIFLSSDGGKGWALLSDPYTPSETQPHIPRPFWAHFAHNPDGSVQAIFVGSVGRGVWRIEPVKTNVKLVELVKLTECNGPCPPDPCLTCPVEAGEKMDWEAQITNAEDAIAGNVVFQHTIPDGMAFQSLEAPRGWRCTTPQPGGSGAVRCTASDLAPGETAKVVVRTHVATGPGKVLLSEISIVSNAIDPDPADNRAFASNFVRGPRPPER